jgi:tetratricopeptide (TPR) repeat protein
LNRGAALVALGVLIAFMGRCAGGDLGIPRPDISGAEAPLAEAVRRAQRAVEDDPGSSEAWGGLGDRFYTPGWTDEAAESYARAAELEPDRFRWAYMLGHSLKFDHPHQAIGAFERAQTIDGAYAPLHANHADLLARLGRAEEAWPHFERAAELEPGHARPRVALAQIDLSAGRYEEAQVRLEAAVKLEGADGRAHRALSQACLALGEPERSAEHARMAAALPNATRMPDPRATMPFEPVGSIALVERGVELATAGRVAEAEQYFRRALDINPRINAGHYYLGLTLARKGDTVGAEQSLRRALELHPSNQEAHSLLGEILVAQSRTEEAVPHLRQAVEDNPEDVNARHGLGLALFDLERDDEAATFLRQALDSYPDDRQSRFRLALVLEHAGDAAGAAEQLEAALDIAREQIDRLQQEIGKGFETRTDVSRQQQELRQTLQETGEVHYRLGLLVLERGAARRAAGHFEEALEMAPGHVEARSALKRARH